MRGGREAPQSHRLGTCRSNAMTAHGCAVLHCGCPPRGPPQGAWQGSSKGAQGPRAPAGSRQSKGTRGMATPRRYSLYDAGARRGGGRTRRQARAGPGRHEGKAAHQPKGGQKAHWGGTSGVKKQASQLASQGPPREERGEGSQQPKGTLGRNTRSEEASKLDSQEGPTSGCMGRRKAAQQPKRQQPKGALGGTRGAEKQASQRARKEGPAPGGGPGALTRARGGAATGWRAPQPPPPPKQQAWGATPPCRRAGSSRHPRGGMCRARSRRTAWASCRPRRARSGTRSLVRRSRP